VTEAACPKCAVEFEAASNRVYAGVSPLTRRGYIPFVEMVKEHSKVRCPACRFEFETDAVRFFGVLGPRGMRRLLIIFTTTFILAAAVIVVVKSPWWN
jgi:hypothetical protein